MTINYDEANDNFERFLIDMDDQLEALEDEASSKGIDIHLSTSSLGKLEELFNLMATNSDKDTIESLIVTFARYLGEIALNSYGGHWVLPMNDPKSINWNTPVVTGHTKEGLEFAPLSVMRAFALRRVSGTLKKALDADINISPIDLIDTIE